MKRIFLNSLFCLLLITTASFISAEEAAAENSKSADSTESDSKKTAASTDFHFSVEPVAGYKTGEANEYLYKNDDGDYKLLSQLEWEQQNLFYAGVSVSGGWKRLSLSCKLTGIFPKQCGSMYDSDWIDLTDVKNDYSISENKFTEGINFSASLSYTFKPLTFLWISPTTGFDYHFFSMEARNGYGWYGEADYSSTHTNVSYDSAYAHYYSSGELQGIDYNRHSYLSWIGFSLSYMPLPCLTLSISPSISPYTYLISRDHHYGKGYYADVTDGWFKAGKIESSCEYKINKWSSIIATIEFYKIWTLEGNTYSSSTGDNDDYTKNTGYHGGADEQYFSAGLSWKITILE